MIYGYVRISTDKQTMENQIFEIENFCKNENMKIDSWIMERISGVKDFKKRRLGKILSNLKSGDIVICSEISRLGRNLFQVMTILHMCMCRKTQVWTIKDRYRLGADLHSKVLAFAFSLSAEIERTMISQRTKEALMRLQSVGKKLGRPDYAGAHKCVLDEKKDFIYQQLRFGNSRAKVARKLGVSSTTLYRFLKKNPDIEDNWQYIFNEKYFF